MTSISGQILKSLTETVSAKMTRKRSTRKRSSRLKSKEGQTNDGDGQLVGTESSPPSPTNDENGESRDSQHHVNEESQNRKYQIENKGIYKNRQAQHL